MILEQETSSQFYLGPAYSGAPFHFHEDAWNALAFGKKVRGTNHGPNRAIHPTSRHAGSWWLRMQPPRSIAATPHPNPADPLSLPHTFPPTGSLHTQT